MLDEESFKSLIYVRNSYFEKNSAYNYIQGVGGGSIIMLKGDETATLISENNIYLDSLGNYSVPKCTEGALIQFWGIVEDRNSLWISNKKCYGGCCLYVFNFAILSLKNSKFLLNIAAYVGGAIALSQNNKVYFENCFFVSCSSNKGGVFYVSERTQLIINQSNFIDNSAESGAILHGIENYDSEIKIVSSYFSNNFANDNLFNLLTAKIAIIDTFFVNNKNTLFYLSRSVLNLQNVTISNHACDNYVVGCIINSNDFSFVSLKFVNFTMIENSAEEGNIYLEFSEGEFSNLIFNDLRNVKKKGSCINLQSSSISLNHSFLTNYDFNCIYSINSSLVLYSNDFNNEKSNYSSFNSDLFRYYGTFYCENCLSIVISDCFFISNKNSDIGGALAILDLDDTKLMALVTNCTFKGNEVTNKAGAIFLNTVNANISNCIFEKNRAYIGGAIVYESLSYIFN